MIDRAQQVFTGRVIDAVDNRVLVDVDEVWQGGPVEQEVWLEAVFEGGPPWATDGRKIPDGYASPEKWVFAPVGGEIGTCTTWALDGEERQRILPFRPDHPQAPVAEGSLNDAGEATRQAEVADVVGSTNDAGWAWLGAALGAAVVLVIVGATIRRRRGWLRDS